MTKRVKREQYHWHSFTSDIQEFIYNTFMGYKTIHLENPIKFHLCLNQISESKSFVERCLSEWEPQKRLYLLKEDMQLVTTTYLCLKETTKLCKNMIQKICQCIICPVDEREKRYLFTEKETWRVCNFIVSVLASLSDKTSISELLLIE